MKKIRFLIATLTLCAASLFVSCGSTSGFTAEYRTEPQNMQINGSSVPVYQYLRFYGDKTFIWGVYPQFDEKGDYAADVESGTYKGSESKPGEVTLTTTSVKNADGWQVVVNPATPLESTITIEKEGNTLMLNYNGMPYTKH